MSFTVEPMLLTGTTTFTQAADGWTEHIDDSMPSAQFEHTVIVTPDGAEILTVTAHAHPGVRSDRLDVCCIMTLMSVSNLEIWPFQGH